MVFLLRVLIARENFKLTLFNIANNINIMKNSFATMEAVMIKVNENDLESPDVADRLGVSVMTVHRWRKQGFFPNAYRLNPKVPKSPWRFPISDIEAIEQQREDS